MAIIISNDGLVFFLQVKVPYLNGMVLHLYQNDTPTDQFNTIDDFEEATFPGYAAVDLTEWTDAYLNPDALGETDYPAVVFTCTSAILPNDIYGYYVTDAGNETVYFWERNAAAPITIDDDGKTYTVILQFLEGTI